MKIAFNLGSTKAQTFIYNQIISIADKNNKILIFGTDIHSDTFNDYDEIKLYLTPQNKIYHTLYLVLNFLKLLTHQPKRFLTTIIYFNGLRKMSLNRKLSWLCQVLPVLNNLPDIFHIQWGKSIESWMFLKYKFGVKIVLSLRGTHINCSPLNDENLRNVYRENFPNIDRFHAVSESLANEALKYGAQKKRIDIIFSPINSKLIKIKKDNWEIDNIFKILSVGRNKWVKGFHIALSAIKEMCDIGININYTIITHDAPSEEILYQIDDLELYEKVFFKTYTDQNKVFQFMSKSDCLLLPSLTEGIANVALEAMLIQLPVISSDCGGMSELIKNGYNGYLFKNRNYISCVNVLNNFLKLPAKEKKIIAMNAKNTIEKNNEIQIIGKKLNYFYQNC